MTATASEPTAPNILLVEDDAALAAMVSDGLRARRYSIWHVECAGDAELTLDQVRPDLIVLDLMLPDRNGLVVCADLKRRAGVPVIICSATKRKDDAVIGFQLGADDFLHKPFSLDELQARIDLALHRGRGPIPGEVDRRARARQVGGLTVDQAGCQAAVHGAALPLTPTEFRLVSALADQAPDVVSRQALGEHVWGCVDEGVIHSLDVHMRRLRTKLKVAAGPRLVTRRGFGYQLLDEAYAAASAG
jgi:two-component system response regulator MtrA